MSALWRWLLGRGRSVPLAVAALGTALLAGPAARLAVDHENVALTAHDPAQARVDARFRTDFGGGDELLLTLTRPDLLERAGLAHLDAVTHAAARVPGVRRVWSLTTVDEVVPGDAGAEARPLLVPPFDAPDAGARARAALARNPDLVGWLVSGDGTTAGLVLELAEDARDPGARARTIAALRALAAGETRDGAALHLTGVPVQKHDVSAFVARDQRVLLPLAVVVLGATLALFFRRPAGVLLPLGLAGLTVLWTTGLYAWTGHATNAITALLPPVLLTVAIVVGVHVYEAWRTAAPAPPADRALAAVRAIAVPATLCAVTTAQGFGSLATSAVPAVREFGLFATAGTLVAFALGMTLLPAVLARLRPVAGGPGEHRLTLRLLDRATDVATARPGAVLAACAAVTAVALAGVPWIRTDTDLVGFLAGDAPLRRDTAFVDARLGGTLPFEFVLRRRDGGAVATLDTLRRLEALEAATRVRPHVTTVTSVLALVRQVHRAERAGGPLALPDEERTLRRELALLDESGHVLVRRFAAPGFRALRVTVRTRAVGTAETAPLLAAIVADAERLLGPEHAFTPAGELYRVVRDSTDIVREQVRSFGTAIVLVVAAIGLLLRSVAFTVLALIPNVLPIVWTGGLMGWTGVALSTGTAMIASAVLGLVVDDTVYYLAHYRRAYRGDAVAAVRETTRAVGAPVTAASVSLVLGFWVGAFGSFTPTIHFSLLTGLTMVTGIACDVLVLPASLVLLDRRRLRDAL